MFFKIYKKERVLYLELGGKILLEHCEQIKNSVLPLLTSKQFDELMVNLKKVSYIDSAGLGMLVGFKMSSNKNKVKFTILSPSKEIQSILEVSKLTEIFPILEGYEAEMIYVSTAKPQSLLKEFTDETHSVESKVEEKIKPQQNLLKKVIQKPVCHRLRKRKHLIWYPKILMNFANRRLIICEKVITINQ